jgi:hypothetical protein
MAPRRGARALLLSLLAVAAPRAEAKEPPGAWAWLEAGGFEGAEPKLAPGLTPEETAVGLAALRSAVTFALADPGVEPAPGTAHGAGYVAGEGGLAVGPWRLLARAREGGPWLYGRTFDGPWVRAFVLGG